MPEDLLDQYGLYNPLPRYQPPGSGGYDGYSITIAALTNLSLLDSGVYYLGISNVTHGSHTTQGVFAVVVPQSGIVRGYTLNFRVSTLGSGEDVLVGLLINGTTFFGENSIVLSATPAIYSFSGINQSVSGGDVIELRMTTPAWVTNPTFTFNGTIYID